MTITFALRLLVDVRVSFRGVTHICQLLTSVDGHLLDLPSPTTVRQWLLRVGWALCGGHCRQPVSGSC